MKVKNKIICMLLMLVLIITANINSAENRNCIILLDHDNVENVGRSDSWFLITRLQSAIAEQTTPILLNISLWNSFIERRINFGQKLLEKDSPHHKTKDLYCAINDKIAYWSKHYNALSNDFCQNKKLVIQNINKEFYIDKNNVTDENFQLLLNHETTFNPKDWDIYRNKKGFYLFIPKKYSAQNSLIGFKTDSLEKVAYPEDSPSIYFDSCNHATIVNALSDFFLTYDDLPDAMMPYSWNIVLAGHGGSKYKESNFNQKVSWEGKPIIADLDVQEFKELLDFFQSKVKTNLFHYSSCYAGGNHISLVFSNEQKKTYNFAITSDTLTDCTSYCKWTNSLPSEQKVFLKTADLSYDSTKKCWQLPLTPVYHWEKFFTGLATLDFSVASLDSLQEIMTFITYPIIANIPLLCLPGSNKFFPLQSSDEIKIDDRLVGIAEKEPITLKGINTLLVECDSIEPTIMLEQTNQLRIISIKPGNATHYIKKIKAMQYIDLPSAFWQAQYQSKDKTFLIEECTFPYSENKEIFKELVNEGSEVVLKNVIVTQQKSHFVRIFFTFNDKALMLVAHKPGQAEQNDKATIQEIITLTADAKAQYEKYYLSLLTKL